MSAELTDSALARLQAANPVAVEEDRGRGVVAQAALARILDDRASLLDQPGDARAAGRVRATRASVPVLIAVTVTERATRRVRATFVTVPVLAG